MGLHTWLVFVAAVLGLSMSPGPNGLLVLTHGTVRGWRRTTSTILGGVIGFVAVIAMSMFGIGAMLQASVAALMVMKWLGGAYLVWLGLQVWRSPAVGVQIDAGRSPATGKAMFLQGLLSAVTNPKVLLFFTAFLPAFIDPARSLVTQYLVIAGTFAAIEFVTEMLIAGMAQRINAWQTRSGRRFNQACGGIIMLLGIVLPLKS
jgi:homoserine/homoserine lactone efflux protein